MSVVEMPEFRRQAAKLLTDEEILDVITEIAKNPQGGEVIASTGGIRKLRFSASGRGKRGGGRAIYVYYCEEISVFVLTCYPKNQKADLTDAEKKTWRGLVRDLRVAYETGIGTRVSKVKGPKRSNEKDESTQD